MAATPDLGYIVVRVDEDGDVVESLQRVAENHIPLLDTYNEAVEVRGDRDPTWWRVATIRLVDNPSTGSDTDGDGDGDD